nr:hypothetical protein [Paracoccus aminovorans]
MNTKLHAVAQAVEGRLVGLDANGLHVGREELGHVVRVIAFATHFQIGEQTGIWRGVPAAVLHQGHEAQRF